MAQEQTYDYIVIGSGFGGSVSAMRLAEKGYSVLVIEKGKRWNTLEPSQVPMDAADKILWHTKADIL
jgi:cholesterol oxidase